MKHWIVIGLLDSLAKSCPCLTECPSSSAGILHLGTGFCYTECLNPFFPSKKTALMVTSALCRSSCWHSLGTCQGSVGRRKSAWGWSLQMCCSLYGVLVFKKLFCQRIWILLAEFVCCSPTCSLFSIFWCPLPWLPAVAVFLDWIKVR